MITPAAWVPVFTLDGEGAVRQLRWNNDDRASMPVEVAEGVGYEEWFEAARVWNSIITDKKNEYWEQLVPGRPVSEFCPFSFSSFCVFLVLEHDRFYC